MTFTKERNVLVILILIRIFLPVIQILRDLKIITIDTDINFMSVSDIFGYIIIITIIYIGMKYYLRGKRQ